MAKIFTYTCPLDADIVDAFCLLQKGFTDQFVYYDKQTPTRYMGLGRCIALPNLEEDDYHCDGPIDQPPIFFSFNRFDGENPSPADELFSSFPLLRFMLPEIVLIENERGVLLQVNSLGPIYIGRVERFLRQAETAPVRARRTIPYKLEASDREEWHKAVTRALDAIRSGRTPKVVLSSRRRLTTEEPFSSKDLLINLIDGPSRGTVLLYRYADVFFCGCTPELLIRKKGSLVTSMALAGTCQSDPSPEKRAALAEALLADPKNRAEHAHVVAFLREAFLRTCYNVKIPAIPTVLPLATVQHLMTPVSAQVLEGVDLWSLVGDLHPTPATAGSPIGEAKMLIRLIEPYNRGFYGGACGFIDGNGDGEFSVALRTGVFDGIGGWIYGGCGIVEGSDANAEYDEIELKLKTILSAFDGGSDGPELCDR